MLELLCGAINMKKVDGKKSTLEIQLNVCLLKIIQRILMQRNSTGLFRSMCDKKKIPDVKKNSV